MVPSHLDCETGKGRLGREKGEGWEGKAWGWLLGREGLEGGK